MAGIIILGIVGSYALPQVAIPLPWTVFILVITIAAAAAVFAFAGAARYSSPAIAAENVRIARFPEPIRYVSDGRMVWAGVPCKGWSYLKTFVNSGTNGGLAILPAAMLEQESELYTVARCKLYHLTDQAVNVLRQKRSFDRLFAGLGYENKKIEVWFGFHSTSLHPDFVHIQSPSDIEAYAQMLSKDSREYKQVRQELDNSLKQKLQTWQRIKGSDAATVVRKEQEEEDRHR
jgi:hypothetical protein